MTQIPPNGSLPSDWRSDELARHWAAQVPSGGFAELTVSAMLARHERRTARSPKRLGRLVLLAALVSASAWGALRAARDLRASHESAAPEQDAPRVAAADVLVMAPLPSSVEAPRVSDAPPVRPKARVTAAGPQQRPGPAAAASVPPPKLIVPRCQCAPGFVVCGCSD